MARFTFEETQRGYSNLWQQCVVDAAKASNLKLIAAQIVAGKARYQRVERVGGVPWFFIAALHYREADLNFNAYLGNGQAWNRVTTEVPVGVGPFGSFEEGCVDALLREGFWKAKWEWTAPRCLWCAEEFNGEGYELAGSNSPYVWDWTNLYTAGLFVADHSFSPSKRENRAGVAAIFKALIAVDSEVKAALEPAPVVAQQPTVQEKEVVPMSTTSDPLQSAESIALTVLPFVSIIFPPIAPFIPIIKALLQIGVDVEAAGGDPAKIAAAIAAHLSTIGTHASELNAPPPQSPPHETH